MPASVFPLVDTSTNYICNAFDLFSIIFEYSCFSLCIYTDFSIQLEKAI